MSPAHLPVKRLALTRSRRKLVKHILLFKVGSASFCFYIEVCKQV